MKPGIFVHRFTINHREIEWVTVSPIVEKIRHEKHDSRKNELLELKV